MLLLSAGARIAGFDEIPPFAQSNMPRLYAKAKELGAEISGPEVFLYDFLPEGGINLRIGIPVREAKGDAGPFEFFTAKALKCASCIYRGSMKGIGQAWDDLTHHCGDKGYKLTHENREVYLLWKSFDSAENETELQRGIE